MKEIIPVGIRGLDSYLGDRSASSAVDFMNSLGEERSYGYGGSSSGGNTESRGFSFNIDSSGSRLAERVVGTSKSEKKLETLIQISSNNEKKVTDISIPINYIKESSFSKKQESESSKTKKVLKSYLEESEPEKERLHALGQKTSQEKKKEEEDFMQSLRLTLDPKSAFGYDFKSSKERNEEKILSHSERSSNNADLKKETENKKQIKKTYRLLNTNYQHHSSDVLSPILGEIAQQKKKLEDSREVCRDLCKKLGIEYESSGEEDNIFSSAEMRGGGGV